jgi:hypothetical protein
MAATPSLQSRRNPGEAIGLLAEEEEGALSHQGIWGRRATAVIMIKQAPDTALVSLQPPLEPY